MTFPTHMLIGNSFICRPCGLVTDAKGTCPGCARNTLEDLWPIVYPKSLAVMSAAERERAAL